jgi:hypothetical protein
LKFELCGCEILRDASDCATALPDDMLALVASSAFLVRGGGCTTTDPGTDELDQAVAENVMRMWVSFARTGNPSVEGLISRPAYTKDNDQYLEIGHPLSMKKGVKDAYLAPPKVSG